jgi:hypothetical protein
VDLFAFHTIEGTDVDVDELAVVTHLQSTARPLIRIGVTKL